MTKSSKYTNDLNRRQRLSVELVWGFCRLFSLQPDWFKYWVISPLVRFVLYYIARYRVRLVKENLAYAFPERSEEERKIIRHNFYRILSEVFVSTLDAAGDYRRNKFLDPNESGTEADALRKELNGGSWIGLSAHFGQWEYLMFWGNFSAVKLLGVYHPLKSKVFDEVFIRMRSKPYVDPTPLKQTIRYCMTLQRDGVKFGVGLIADQNPPLAKDSHWIEFLGRETIFFEGGEKMALKLKLPVYFIYQRRLGRGVYRFAWEQIYDGKEEVEPFEITRRYVKKLEAAICENPEMWLWSHKRWKHKRERAEQRFKNL